jgi:hypothetical protein
MEMLSVFFQLLLESIVLLIFGCIVQIIVVHYLMTEDEVDQRQVNKRLFKEPFILALFYFFLSFILHSLTKFIIV